jgi:hypothetical protein
MTPVVLDTDVVSFLFKNDTRAQAYLLITARTTDAGASGSFPFPGRAGACSASALA